MSCSHISRGDKVECCVQDVISFLGCYATSGLGLLHLCTAVLAVVAGFLLVGLEQLPVGQQVSVPVVDLCRDDHVLNDCEGKLGLL